MEFKDGFIGMLVRTKDDQYAYICGIGLNGSGEPIFKIKCAIFDHDSFNPTESEVIDIHPQNVFKLK